MKGIIEKPYMYDSSEEEKFSEKVSMEIEKISGKDSNTYKLVVTADEGFHKNKNTVYPVVIDSSTWLGTGDNMIPEYIDYTYDINNNLVVTNTDEEARITKKYYNEADQLIKDEANGTYVTYYYDYIGDMFESKDAENRETNAVGC